MTLRPIDPALDVVSVTIPSGGGTVGLGEGTGYDRVYVADVGDAVDVTLHAGSPGAPGIPIAGIKGIALAFDDPPAGLWVTGPSGDAGEVVTLVLSRGVTVSGAGLSAAAASAVTVSGTVATLEEPADGVTVVEGNATGTEAALVGSATPCRRVIVTNNDAAESIHVSPDGSAATTASHRIPPGCSHAFWVADAANLRLIRGGASDVAFAAEIYT